MYLRVVYRPHPSPLDFGNEAPDLISYLYLLSPSLDLPRYNIHSSCLLDILFSSFRWLMPGLSATPTTRTRRKSFVAPRKGIAQSRTFLKKSCLHGTPKEAINVFQSIATQPVIPWVDTRVPRGERMQAERFLLLISCLRI